MSLSKTQLEDKIEVIDANGIKQIHVRTATIITDNGTEIGRSYSRKVVSPLSDLDDCSPEVRSIASAVFTPEVIQAYENANSEEV